MTRPYGVKGRKRKDKEAKYDREDEDEQAQPKKPVLQNEEPSQPTPTPAAAEEDELAGIPIVPSDHKSDNPSVIFILERASLEVAKVGKVLLTLQFGVFVFFSFCYTPKVWTLVLSYGFVYCI